MANFSRLSRAESGGEGENPGTAMDAHAGASRTDLAFFDVIVKAKTPIETLAGSAAWRSSQLELDSLRSRRFIQPNCSHIRFRPEERPAERGEERLHAFCEGGLLRTQGGWFCGPLAKEWQRAGCSRTVRALFLEAPWPLHGRQSRYRLLAHLRALDELR